MARRPDSPRVATHAYSGEQTPLSLSSKAILTVNVLTNAIHYNKPGGEVRVSTRTENGAAILTVADTGIGIMAEDLPHVFERFYRADKSRARSNGRVGLGLALCKSIVELHGGTIHVTSEIDTGTTFVVRLPLTPAES